MIKKVINDLKKIALSGDDIYKALNRNALIMTYADLRKYNNIDDLFKKHDNVVILYETSQGFGHWVALYKARKGVITFFDSYGMKPDDELKFIPKNFRKENDTNYPLLTYLLYKSGYKVEYNQHKLQKDLSDVSTCGRHVIIRLQNKKIPVDQYAKILRSYKGFSPDDVVTLLTGNIQ